MPTLSGITLNTQHEVTLIRVCMDGEKYHGCLERDTGFDTTMIEGAFVDALANHITEDGWEPKPGTWLCLEGMREGLIGLLFTVHDDLSITTGVDSQPINMSTWPPKK